MEITRDNLQYKIFSIKRRL